MFPRQFFEKIDNRVKDFMKSTGVSALTVTIYTEEKSYNVAGIVEVTEEVLGFIYFDSSKAAKVRTKDFKEMEAHPMMFLRLKDVTGVELNPGEAAKKFGFGE